jgi:hypothetical protein
LLFGLGHLVTFSGSPLPFGERSETDMVRRYEWVCLYSVRAAAMTIDTVSSRLAANAQAHSATSAEGGKSG